MFGHKTVCYFNFQKDKIRMDFQRGNMKTDGSKSKNFFTLDDPKQISKESSWKWKNGNTGHTYKVPLNKNFDVDYVKFLIKQKYNNLSQQNAIFIPYKYCQHQKQTFLIKQSHLKLKIK